MNNILEIYRNKSFKKIIFYSIVFSFFSWIICSILLYFFNIYYSLFEAVLLPSVSDLIIRIIIIFMFIIFGWTIYKVFLQKIEKTYNSTPEEYEIINKAFEISNDGFWEWDLLSNKRTFSSKCKKLLDYNDSEISNSLGDWEARIHPDDRNSLYEEMQKHLDDLTDIYKFECRILSKTGIYKWIIDKGIIIKHNSSGKPIKMIGTFTDISESKKIEESLRQEMAQLLSIFDSLDELQRKRANKSINQLNLELIDKNKELEQIIFVSSHDLRSPLVNIQGFSKELENSVKTVQKIINNETDIKLIRDKTNIIFDKDINDSFSFIFSNASKVYSLLAGLMKLSRLGRTTLQIKHIDMNKLVKEVLETFDLQSNLIINHITIEDLPTCQGDEVMIKQVVYNLIDNAQKFSSHQRPLKVKISGFKHESESIYCIEDNGIGVPLEYQKNIFEIFHRLNPNINGEGLGLTIARKILYRHNGRLWIESEQEEGSKFYFSLSSILKTSKKELNF